MDKDSQYAQYDGMRAMSQEEMAKRQMESAHLMRNAYPDGINMQGIQNAYNSQVRTMLENVGRPMPKPSAWERFKWWLSDKMN